jgi:hypothetical protein
VTRIDNETFGNCTSLTSINIPISLTEIKDHAFSNCPLLTLIAIPQAAVIDRFGSPYANCRSLQQRQVNGYNHHDYNLTLLRQRFDDLLLHHVFYYSPNTMTMTLLTNIIQQHPSDMLTSTDAMLMTPLHVLCCNPAVSAVTIRILKDTCLDVVSMTNVLDETPLMMYLKCTTKDYNAYHVNGQLLPLIKLLEQGIKCEVLEVIWVFCD